MSNSFGTKFILVSDIQQVLNPKIFGGGPWIHLATIVRGFKEYICFKHGKTDKIYMELVDPTHSTLFKKIEDENEFEDLQSFLKEAGVLSIQPNEEFKIAGQKK